MSRTLNIKWLDGSNALSEIRPAWQSLEQSTHASIFTSWDWLNAWWTHYGQNKNLHILVIKIDEQVAFILPFQVITQYTLGVLAIEHWLNLGSKSSAGCDYLGAVFDSTLQLSDHELQLIFDAIQDKKPARSILHFNETGTSAFPNKVQAINFLEKHRRVYQDEPTYCPAIQLPDSWDEYLGSLSRNFRSQIRRDLKKFEANDELNISVHRSPEDMPAKVNELKRLNTQRIAQLGQVSSFQSDNLAPFIAEATEHLASSQHCTFYQLHHNEKSIGIILLIHNKQAQYYYLGGFDEEYKKHSPINILFIHAIKAAIDNGDIEFNLLKGQEPYKYRWQAIDDVNENLTILDKSIGQITLYFTEQFFFRLNRKIRHLWKRYTKQQ